MTERPRLLPLLGHTGGRDSMTCLYRCGNACDHPVPNASDNPYRRWSKGFSKANLADRFGFDSVSSWSVPKRGSAARLNGVLITGKKAGKTVTVSFTGTQARARLGLRSPGFTFGSMPKASSK